MFLYNRKITILENITKKVKTKICTRRLAFIYIYVICIYIIFTSIILTTQQEEETQFIMCAKYLEYFNQTI